jgi:lipopolysaccharide biosynthesis regulator YciM
LRLARVYAHEGAFERAEGLIRAAIGTYGEMFGQDHPYVAEALAELGPMLRAAGRMEEAERELRHVIGFVEAAYGPDHPKLVVLLDELASVLRPSGSAECEQLTRRAASIRFTALNAGENSQD